MNDSSSGIYIYTIPPPLRVDSIKDEVAFGFMTRKNGGTIFRIDDENEERFLQAKLVSVEFVKYVYSVLYSTKNLCNACKEIVFFCIMFVNNF